MMFEFLAGQGPQSESIRHYLDKECLEKNYLCSLVVLVRAEFAWMSECKWCFYAQLHLRFEMIPYVSFYTCCVWTQWSLGTMFEFREKDINSWLEFRGTRSLSTTTMMTTTMTVVIYLVKCEHKNDTSFGIPSLSPIKILTGLDVE